MKRVMPLAVSKLNRICLLLALLAPAALSAPGDDFAALCRDRLAIEQVYYAHRLGDKPPFDEALSRQTLERLVREDLRKEAALKKFYGIEVTSRILAREVQRIDETTRAPDVLAELKSALNRDPVRFARAVARPIVVERLLRQYFENDDAIHASQRRTAEQIRQRLLEARQDNVSVSNLVKLLKRSTSNDVWETTWELRKPSAGGNPDSVRDTEVKNASGPPASLVAAPGPEPPRRKAYFHDLPHGLQEVLRAQLQKAGDITAVIESAEGFSLHVAREKTADILSVVTVSIPKRSYEDWVDEQEASTR
jgi:hypothetical protein